MRQIRTQTPMAMQHTNKHATIACIIASNGQKFDFKMLLHTLGRRAPGGSRSAAAAIRKSHANIKQPEIVQI